MCYEYITFFPEGFVCLIVEISAVFFFFQIIAIIAISGPFRVIFFKLLKI